MKQWSTPDLSMAVPASLRALQRRISALSAAVNDHPSPCWRYFFDCIKHGQQKNLSTYSSLRNFPSETPSSAPELAKLAPTSALQKCAPARALSRGERCFEGIQSFTGWHKRTPNTTKPRTALRFGALVWIWREDWGI